MALTATFRVVTLRRILPLIALLLSFTGCATSYTSNIFTRNHTYRTIRITDLQGRLVANWTAEGRVWRNGRGYRFRAIERICGGPEQIVSRYPHGRKVIVDGPNIVVLPAEKPKWLVDIEGF